MTETRLSQFGQCRKRQASEYCYGDF